MEILLGAILGLLTNLFVWWLYARRIVPRARFSDKIAVGRGHGGRPTYSIRIENAGRRPAVDCKVSCRVAIRGLPGDAPTRWRAVYVPLSDRGEVETTIPWLVPARRGSRYRITLRLRPNLIGTTLVDPWSFDRSTLRTLRRKTLTMHDVLALGKEAYAQLHFSGTDAVSGTRRGFLSPLYRLDSLTDGEFARDGMNIDDGSEVRPVQR